MPCRLFQLARRPISRCRLRLQNRRLRLQNRRLRLQNRRLRLQYRQLWRHCPTERPSAASIFVRSLVGGRVRSQKNLIISRPRSRYRRP